MSAAEGRPTTVLLDVDGGDGVDADRVNSASGVVLPPDLPSGTKVTLTQSKAKTRLGERLFAANLSSSEADAYEATATCYYDYGCLEVWGDDGKCHLPCDNEACDWDMGDCKLAGAPVVAGRECPPGAAAVAVVHAHALAFTRVGG